MKWLPFIGWRDLDMVEALELELEQAGRYTWQVFCFEWLGFGFTFTARPKL